MPPLTTRSTARSPKTPGLLSPGSSAARRGGGCGPWRRQRRSGVRDGRLAHPRPSPRAPQRPQPCTRRAARRSGSAGWTLRSTTPHARLAPRRMPRPSLARQRPTALALAPQAAAALLWPVSAHALLMAWATSVPVVDVRASAGRGCAALRWPRRIDGSG
ncbi:MAG: hypothetical protein J3K34DRAFT_25887 [Monoraphidium minutum]|nr:MAG: hypothetical protein J3K34DRAFT_25887 [Monoraphidium minutum]